jgi:hypothetical protein
MIHYFHEIGIAKHDQDLYDMGIKEKEHEIYFLSKIKNYSPFLKKCFLGAIRKRLMTWI